MPVDTSQLERDLKIIRDRRGKDIIHMGNEQPPTSRIAIDSPGLMRITGGGFPIGNMTRLWGGPSTGKSLIGWMIIAAAQQLKTKRFKSGLLCCYWNVEKQYDEIFTAERGVDVDELHIEESTIIEDISGEMEVLMNSIHLHVLDSASFAVSQDELNTDPGEWRPGIDARAWKKAINRIHNGMDKDENVLVVVDHSGFDWTTHVEHALSGRRMEFKSDLSLHFVKGSWLFYDEHGFLEKSDKIKETSGMGLAGLKEADGTEVVVKCNKSRVCRPLRSARMRLDLNTFEFDKTFELVEAAKYFDEEGGVAIKTKKSPIAEKTGAKSAWYDIGGSKVQGARGLRLAIDSDPKLKELITIAMLAGN